MMSTESSKSVKIRENKVTCLICEQIIEENFSLRNSIYNTYKICSDCEKNFDNWKMI